MESNKFSIIMFSGTADKFIPLGILSQAAAAMGYEVNIFITGFALLSFTKNPTTPPFPTEFAKMAPDFMKGMEHANMPTWNKMLKEAKELGAKISACSAMSTVLNLNKTDMNDLIDEVVGAATFLQKSSGGQVIFI